MENIAWRQLFELLSQYTLALFRMLQLNCRSNTMRWNLWLPDLRFSHRYFSISSYNQHGGKTYWQYQFNVHVDNKLNKLCCRVNTRATVVNIFQSITKKRIRQMRHKQCKLKGKLHTDKSSVGHLGPHFRFRACISSYIIGNQSDVFTYPCPSPNGFFC